MSNKIELLKLWAKPDKNGRMILSGRFGFSTIIRIEELPLPDEKGATHVAYLTPVDAPKSRDDEAQRWPKQQRAAPTLLTPDGQLAAYSSWAKDGGE